jgi:hypothetical protein
VDYSFWSRQGGEKKGKVTQGKANVRLEEDAQGLKLVCSGATLEQMSLEDWANARDPESGAPTRQALRNLSPATLSEFMNAADWVLRILKDAVLVEDRQEWFNGIQARCLALKLNPKLSALYRKYVKDLQSSCKVWLGPDGLPIGLTQEVKARGRIFLVVAFEHSETAECRFARSGNRLVTTYRKSEYADSGGGESGRFRETFNLAIDQKMPVSPAQP